MESLGTNRGVRKVSEKITEQGRTLIITETNNDKLNWGLIPDGTLHVDPVTGAMSVKLFGESTWVPVMIGGSGALEIAKDAILKYEVFTITNADNQDGTFSYSNTKGEERTGYIDPADGWMVFDLEEGTYVLNRNKLEIIVDDVMHRSVVSGGIREIDEERFAMVPVKTGSEVTVKFIQNFDAGSLYPRLFISETEPIAKEYGDLWMDLSEVIQ
ncbi:hypothetical protein [Lysinibacillus fusiformis]|uniref:hypothetical protein n=1 Tax=Lysinibacillus fusiformis TaxID=28031 RepID=UPI0018823B54|nr:hypothetical protein [Lysinibacillus fusiformis]MBD8524026.1 hypothetical protein [Lysinibacillus fusiformis]